MSAPCIYCSCLEGHRPNCVLQRLSDGRWCDALPEQVKFSSVHRAVMQGVNHIAQAISNTMAHRIANALNQYKPGSRGY